MTPKPAFLLAATAFAAVAMAQTAPQIAEYTHALAISPDGKTIFAGREQNAALFGTEFQPARGFERVFAENEAYFWSAAFGPSGYVAAYRVYRRSATLEKIDLKSGAVVKSQGFEFMSDLDGVNASIRKSGNGEVAVARNWDFEGNVTV